MAAFTPLASGTYRITVGTSATTLTVPARPTTIRVLNATSANTLYMETTGLTAVVPTAGSGTGAMPLLGGASAVPLILEKGLSPSISFIASGASTDVFVTIGNGDSAT